MRGLSQTALAVKQQGAEATIAWLEEVGRKSREDAEGVFSRLGIDPEGDPFTGLAILKTTATLMTVLALISPRQLVAALAFATRAQSHFLRDVQGLPENAEAFLTLSKVLEEIASNVSPDLPGIAPIDDPDGDFPTH